MKLSPDPWLAEIIGQPAFRVLPGEPAALREPLAAGFYYAKIPTSDIASVSTLEQQGFRVVDVNVTLEHAGGARAEEPAPAVVRVREHRPEDHAALLEMAETSFTVSRFHLDPQFPAELANRIKREWVASYLAGRRGDRLWVAEIDQRPAGFLAALAAAEPSLAVIDLIGVAAAARRRGVGKALVLEFARCYADRAQRRVGTQVANLPSLRLYEECGFRLAESAYVLHAHVA